MTHDIVLEHWNQRAQLPSSTAGSDDVIAKEIEVNAISKYIKDGMVVAEFGCGNAATAIELLKRYNIELYCFDFSSVMIDQARKLVEAAGLQDKIHLSVCDVRDEPEINKKFDVVYTERMIINLPDWNIQEKAIRYLTSHLKENGYYLMCENSEQGLNNINKLRVSVGLPSISSPWHNVYLYDDLVLSLVIKGIKLVDVELFSATYYFLSRVVNAWLAAQENQAPSYLAPINTLALQLPPFSDCAQGKLWVLKKNDD
jgi:ubiquinone/menaquinone biosynthesis C-methylase UbiE